MRQGGAQIPARGENEAANSVAQDTNMKRSQRNGALQNVLCVLRWGAI